MSTKYAKLKPKRQKAKNVRVSKKREEKRNEENFLIEIIRIEQSIIKIKIKCWDQQEKRTNTSK